MSQVMPGKRDFLNEDASQKCPPGNVREAAYGSRAGAKLPPTFTRSMQAFFRQINKGALHTNHDALEFPDGEIVLLTRLCEGQNATVLTLPTQPKSAAEAEAQQRVAYVG
jgi:hypothetical protein